MVQSATLTKNQKMRYLNYKSRQFFKILRRKRYCQRFCKFSAYGCKWKNTKT